MGNKTGNVTSVDFNPKQWQVTDRQASQNQSKGNFKILQNLRTGQLIDEYQLFWPSEEDFRFYLDSYYWRRQEYNIVPSRYIVEQHSDQFCSKSYGAKVYIENIPTRLSDVTDIPYPDNLYVALAVLEGYQKLYENVHHYFPISEDQICVDREGIVKVWVNSDLSKNYPEPEQSTVEHKDEAHMVDELLNVIWENTDQESQPQSFRQFFAKKKGKKRIGFDQAKVIVNQYAKNVSCQIPEKFVQILQMIEESDEYQHTQNDNQHPDEEYHGLQNAQNEEYQHEDQEQQYIMGQEHPYEQHAENYSNQYVGQSNYNTNQQQGNIYNVPQSQMNYEQPVYYQNLPNTHYTVVPVPHALNPPFIPRQVSPSNGPIITIPPVRGNFGAPAIYHSFNAPVVYQNRIQPQRIQETRQNKFINRQPIQMNSLLERPTETIKIQPFSNNNFAYQQRVSQLNPQSGSSQHEVNQQQQQTTEENQGQKLGQYSNRRQLNGPVGRSLQLMNQSSKKNLQTQKIRVNKSQIDQSAAGQGYQVNYPKGYEEMQYSNRRISGANSKSGDNYVSEKNVQELQYITQQQLDTKYYTLDTEVELDEEIAADLKKMILAL